VKPHQQDPYLLRSAYKEPTVCPTCKLVYHHKRWFWNDEMLKELEEQGANHQKCPACRKIEDKYPMGILHMSGTFLSEHKDDILRMLKNEEKRAMEKNPLERIMSIEEDDEGLISVQTTSESLVLRMGRILHRAYSGDVEYKFSDTEKLVRVEWTRD
jgi:NMD protein affecting ribosome stability and mRNA decay